VREENQRTGVGFALVDSMLGHERTEPRKVAWDRPTPKSLAFLSKHFGLTNYVPQPNNFVVFDEYFR